MLVGVVTGSRSEWGVLEPLVKRIHDDPELELRLYVTGSHLSPEFHLTVQEISFPIYERLETLLSADTLSAQAKSIGLGILGFTDALKSHPPDVLVLEGDRFEMFAAAVVAYTLGIPIAHISGGDVTSGSLDDGYRNAITHMATLHYPDHEKALKRIDAMLGSLVRVFYNARCFGCLSLDGLEPYQGKRSGYVLVAHPCDDFTKETLELIFDWCPYYLNAASSANADAGGRVFNKIISDMLKDDWHRQLENLDRRRFLSCLSMSQFIIGNSSSGIVEAPALGTPTINIGKRQQGRPMASSIIQADPTVESIKEALHKLELWKLHGEPYGIDLAYTGGNVTEQIIDHLKEWHHAH